MPSDAHSEPQVIRLPSAEKPLTPPSLPDLAAFVDRQAEDLKELCYSLKAAFEACAQDLDPGLDADEMFDPIAARFLWHHVPDLGDIASRVSVLGFWLQVLCGVLDIQHQSGASR